jgi:hypothetical protein
MKGQSQMKSFTSGEAREIHGCPLEFSAAKK